MRNKKGKLLLKLLVLCILVNLIVFLKDVSVLAEEDTGPVGEPWIVGLHSSPTSYKPKLLMAGVEEKEILTVYFEKHGGYWEEGYDGESRYYRYHQFVDAPLSLEGGIITADFHSANVDISGGERWAFAYHGGINVSNEGVTALRFQSYVRNSVDETYRNRLLGFSPSSTGVGTAKLIYPEPRNVWSDSEDIGRAKKDIVFLVTSTHKYPYSQNEYNITRIYKHRDEEIFQLGRGITMYNMISRSDSGKIYFKYNNQNTGTYGTASVNSDGTGYQEMTHMEGTLIREVPSRNYLIHSVYQGPRVRDHIFRSNTNGTRGVKLIDHTSANMITQITDDYIYYMNDEKTYRQHIEHTGINELVFNFVPRQMYTPDDENFFYIHKSEESTIYKYLLNDALELILDSPLNSTLSKDYYIKEEGLSTINVSGSVRDTDNDLVTVTATLAGITKEINISDTRTAKPFNLTFDVIEDKIAEGNYTLTVSAVDSKGENAPDITRNIIVKGRVKHNGYVLVDSPLHYSIDYKDVEDDVIVSIKGRHIHDSNYFDNSMGIIEDNNMWVNNLHGSFSLPGHYRLSAMVQDIPKGGTGFHEFRRWSRESLSEINLYVHRKPIAIFRATADSNGRISITDVDKSYDLDHQSEVGKGIIDLEWRWKDVTKTTWTTGKIPPTWLPRNKEYTIALRVRDKDGINGLGVWSDWTEVNVSTGGANEPKPLKALFTIEPSSVSHKASAKIKEE